VPTYTFRRISTGETFVEFMTISEMESRLAAGNLELEPSAPRIVSGVASARNKPDSGFRDVLKRIKTANRGSKINTW